jgi:acetyl esterase/lipase
MFLSKYKIILGCFLAVVYSSFANAQDTVSHNGIVGIKYKDIAYKPANNSNSYEEESCKLDIYIPIQKQKDFPVLVFFHGGGLVSGDKEEGWTDWSNYFGYEFLKRGIAIVSVNYRLSGPKAKWPAYLIDAAASVSWVSKNIKSYGGNANSIFVSGYSAGGYITHMLSIDPQWYQKIGFNDSGVCGYIPMSGQTRQHANLAADLGIDNSELSTTYKHVMPLGNIRKGNTPIYIITGGDEGQTIVDNERYFTLLKEAGNTVFFYVEPGKNHIQMRDSFGDSISVARQKIIGFINRYKKD